MSRFPLRTERKAILLPSGDQVGWASSNPLKVICLLPEPSAFITQISPSGPRPPRVHASFFPFGDQAGNTSSILSSVSFTWFDPSGRIVQRSLWPPRSLWKTINPCGGFAPAGSAAATTTTSSPSSVTAPILASRSDRPLALIPTPGRRLCIANSFVDGAERPAETTPLDFVSVDADQAPRLQHQCLVLREPKFKRAQRGWASRT